MKSISNKMYDRPIRSNHVCIPCDPQELDIESIEITKKENNETCIICLEEILIPSDNSDNLFPCKHYINVHVGCRKGIQKCPLCRVQLNTKERYVKIPTFSGYIMCIMITLLFLFLIIWTSAAPYIYFGTGNYRNNTLYNYTDDYTVSNYNYTN